MRMVKFPLPSIRIRKRCKQKLFSIARKHQVPPALITAHNRQPEVCVARNELIVAMVDGLGISRYIVAIALGRSPRRIRASVLNGTELEARRQKVTRPSAC
jgi:hypothetical protein